MMTQIEMLLRKKRRRVLNDEWQKGWIPGVSSPARSVEGKKRSMNEVRTGHICGSAAMKCFGFSEHRHNSARSSGEAGPPDAANEVNVPPLCLAQIVLQPESMLMHCEHKLPCMKPCQGLAVGGGPYWFTLLHFEIFRALHWPHTSTYAPREPGHVSDQKEMTRQGGLRALNSRHQLSIRQWRTKECDGA